MILFPLIARSIGHRCHRASKPCLQRLPTFNSVSDSSAFPPHWHFQTTRTLILEPFSESVKLRRFSDSDSGIVELVLDRPAAKNSIGKDMLRGLQHSFDAISNDYSARVMLISSAVPKVFCAGADLKERKAMASSEVHSFVNSLRSTFMLLEVLHLPTIAVIEGAALGGGLEMALSCDIRICGEDAILGLPETGLAIIPGAGGTQRLPRLVGKSIAKELIFTGARVSGRHAMTLGLVNHCVASGEAHRKALEMAREISEKGPVAVRMAKRAINEGLNTNLESGMNLEEECYKGTLQTKDRLEGLAAFAEKRKPNYAGE